MLGRSAALAGSLILPTPVSTPRVCTLRSGPFWLRPCVQYMKIYGKSEQLGPLWWCYRVGAGAGGRAGAGTLCVITGVPLLPNFSIVRKTCFHSWRTASIHHVSSAHVKDHAKISGMSKAHVMNRSRLEMADDQTSKCRKLKRRNLKQGLYCYRSKKKIAEVDSEDLC